MTNYIGRDLDKISNIEILDNITFDGSQSYTLQKGGVNFTPNSAQSIILGIDGITQIGNFSVNGSTIDFGVAVANTSTCNYIIHLGTGLLTAPSDGSVTNAKLGTAPTLEAKGSGGTAGGVRYFCEQSSHHVTLRAGQHSGFSSGSFELKLPTAQGGANTFLKNDGSGNLSFAEAGGGAYEKISTTTVSSAVASVDFDTLSTDYRDFRFVLSGIKNATHQTGLTIRVKRSGQSSYDSGSSDYRYASIGRDDSGNTQTNNSTGRNYMLLSPVGGASPSSVSFTQHSFTVDFYDVHSTDHRIFYFSQGASMEGTYGGTLTSIASGYRNTNGALIGIQFKPESGNWSDGTFTIYGRKI